MAALPRRAGRLLRRPRRGQRRAGPGVRGERREQEGDPGRGRGAAAGHRPRRRQARLPRHRRPLGRRGQGAARPDQVARGADAQGRAGDPLGRGRPVEAQRPGEVGPRRRHARPARAGRRGLEADLEKARTAGDDRRVKDLEEQLASRQQFLDDGPQRARRLLLTRRACCARPNPVEAGLRAPTGAPTALARRPSAGAQRAWPDRARQPACGQARHRALGSSICAAAKQASAASSTTQTKTPPARLET